jgi:transposase-like protein
LLPDAPVPDGRTVLTSPHEHKLENQSVVTGSIYRSFIRDTNAIEALNRQLRKAIKTKGSFPNEDAARKLVYLALQNAVPQWTRTRNWTTALLAFKIHFGDRILDTAS